MVIFGRGREGEFKSELLANIAHNKDEYKLSWLQVVKAIIEVLQYIMEHRFNENA